MLFNYTYIHSFKYTLLIYSTPLIIHAALNLCHYTIVYQIDILCIAMQLYMYKEFTFIRLHLFIDPIK